jgi:HEAT repeat protein
MAISAAEGLGESGDPQAMPHLLRAALTHSSDQVRSFSRMALGKFGTAPAGKLREAALSADPAVRARAISILGGIYEEQDIPLLTAAARDQDRDVRKAAISTLEGVDAKPAVAALIERLQDEDENLVRYAAISLGRNGNADAVPALIECLNRDDEIAEAAANSLERIGTRPARQAAIAWKRRKGK